MKVGEIGAEESEGLVGFGDAARYEQLSQHVG
jgi:hypothetical protein